MRKRYRKTVAAWVLVLSATLSLLSCTPDADEESDRQSSVAESSVRETGTSNPEPQGSGEVPEESGNGVELPIDPF